MKTHLISASLWLATMLHAGQTDITGPVGSGSFGHSVTLLPNGNFVVTDPDYDAPGPVSNVGAVYLYSGTGTLLSAIMGSTDGDQVGSGKVVVLTNGNFIFASPSWDNGAVIDAGAVTWGSATTGFPGGPGATVSAANSLVGSTANDSIGDDSTSLSALANGNYVVLCGAWDNGATADVGSATWGNGATGTSGAISAANSLIGSTASDQVGIDGVAVLPNGNYVVISPRWTDSAGPTSEVGAVTWCNGSGPTVAVVSGTNSLIGSTEDDMVGGGGVKVLANSNYLVLSPAWDNGVATNAGAVTWGSGTSGISGPLSAANSLVGNSTNDGVGNNFSHVVELATGHYVVGTSSWANGAATSAGAVTWGNGTTGVSGPISDANSLVGATTDDQIGSIIVPLTNGHYVTASQYWDNGAVMDVGAVTWGNGMTGITGPVSASNSMIGATAEDHVGEDGVVALTNGNYVVCSSDWDDPTRPNLGAATWVDGSVGRTGFLTVINSLTGTDPNDQVASGGVVALTNGHYVVISPNWQPSPLSSYAVGAVTWGNGYTGSAGPITAGNSLVGNAENQSIPSGPGVVPLTNGHYVVVSSLWENNGQAQAGAVTWCNGFGGTVGVVSASNSLMGTSFLDQVGSGGIVALANGNFLVRSPLWNNGAISDAGAVTWVDGSTGLVGTVSAANSLVGSSAFDRIGHSDNLIPGLATFSDGSYVLHFHDWDNGGTGNAGAVSPGTGTSSVVGPVTSANSVLGTEASDGPNLGYAWDVTFRRLIVGRPGSNIVTLMSESGTVTLDNTLFTVAEPAVTANILLVVRRTGGSHGTLNVTVATTSSGGTAKEGLDYTGVSQNLSFAPGEMEHTVSIPILADAVANEANETFKVTLTGTAGEIGPITTATLRIIDGGDTANTKAPTISTPKQDARVGVNPAAMVTISGTATDNKGIVGVELSLNGGPWQLAPLTSVNGTSANYSLAMLPVTGVNTVKARSFDTANPTNISPESAVRRFVVTRPLRVSASGGDASITSGFSPVSFREAGKRYSVTATPKSGFLFQRWQVGTSGELATTGLTLAALELPTLSFVFREGMQLNAVIAPNPYSEAGVAGKFSGTITASNLQPDRAPSGTGPEDGTTPSFSTEGSITFTVQKNGSFSGKIHIDGLSPAISGTFDASGTARFGSTRAVSLSVPRSGKPSLILSLQMDVVAPYSGQITGFLSESGSLLMRAVSVVNASLCTTSVADDDLLATGRKAGKYTVALPFQPLAQQPAGTLATTYPQGHGIGNLTLNPSGSISFSGILADGTSFSTSGTLTSLNEYHHFISLYSKKGYLLGHIQFDSGGSDSDLLGTVQWLRPILDNQHYSSGWPQGVQLGVKGCLYKATSGSSILPGLSAADVDGNATIEFSNGSLPSLLSRRLNVQTNDKIQKIAPTDAGLTLTVDRSNGRLSGSFTHADGTKPKYKAIILQKGGAPRYFGHFKTVTPPVKDYTGQSGAVELFGQP